jgi:hypothetical protein
MVRLSEPATPQLEKDGDGWFDSEKPETSLDIPRGTPIPLIIFLKTAQEHDRRL